MVIFCHSANAYDGAPFLYEFGHSSDIYIDTEKNQSAEKQKKKRIVGCKRNSLSKRD